MSADPTAPAGYEFTAGQNKLIGRLARKMRGAGLSAFLLGLVSLVVAGLVGLALASDDETLLPHRQTIIVLIGFFAIAGLVGVGAGWWLIAAGRAFRQIVDTRGSDIPLLMTALDRLYKTVSLVGTVLLFLVVMTVVLVVGKVAMEFQKPMAPAVVAQPDGPPVAAPAPGSQPD